jgi:hypothetical protein
MHDAIIQIVRTTLQLDDDLVSAARELAQERGVTLGRIVSDLARQALTANSPQTVRNGVRLLPVRVRSPRPNLRIVNKLRDEA